MNITKTVSSAKLAKAKILPLVWLIGLLPFFSLQAETIRVAVASNFLKAAQHLSKMFEAQSEHSIQISSGSSGKLYLQITQGAPFDLFLSADTQKPQQLVKNGFAASSTRKTYAIGKLTLWLKACTNASDLSILLSPEIKKIAIANPKLAPYGMASRQLLEKYQLWQKLENKLIFPENISQVAQMSKIGVVDAAFIATSNAETLLSNEHSCLITLMTTDYQPIEQQLVIVDNSNKKEITKFFVKFITSVQGQTLIKNMGYLLPDSGKMSQIE